MELLLLLETQLQSVQLSLPSFGHTTTDIQRGVARMERGVRRAEGGKWGGKMDICNVNICVLCDQQILNY